MNTDDQQALVDRVLLKHAATLHLTRPPRTPLEELIGREEEGTEDENQWRVDFFRKMLDYMFQDGCEPIRILRFVYALAKAVRPELIADMPLADISIICADGGRATVSARIKRIYNKELEAAGSNGTAAPFQKRGNYAAPQKGNGNRRGTGKKESTNKNEKASTKLKSAGRNAGKSPGPAARARKN